MGAPFGGDTTIQPGYGYKEGVGALAAAGYAFIPNFGIDAFFHYDTTSIAVRRGHSSDIPSDNTAHVLLYGLEARGIIGSGPVIGWSSIGASLGSGSLSYDHNNQGAFAGPNVQAHSDESVTFNVMPVLAFGAEFEVTRGLAIGPTMRWYVTNVSTACDDTTATLSDPSLGTATATNTTCAQQISDVTVPDILFVGVGLAYGVGI